MLNSMPIKTFNYIDKTIIAYKNKEHLYLGTITLSIIRGNNYVTYQEEDQTVTPDEIGDDIIQEEDADL